MSRQERPNADTGGCAKTLKRSDEEPNEIDKAMLDTEKEVMPSPTL